MSLSGQASLSAAWMGIFFCSPGESHCGEEEECRLRGPPQAEKPANSILFTRQKTHAFSLVRQISASALKKRSARIPA